MAKVLVFGKHGQIASEMRKRVANSSDYKFLSRDEFAVSDPSAISILIQQSKPQFVVNCAAFTAVDKAESETQEAYRLNSELVKIIAESASAIDAHLLHFSTDYVFDGEASRPYIESDATSPLSVYGKSKLAGEKAVFEISKRATILRTSWVYSEFGSNFVKTIVRLANGEKPLRVVADQIGTPTSAGDLADFVIDKLIAGERRNGVDLVHFSGEGQASWNEFAIEIARLWNTKQRQIEKIPTSEFPTPAVRPAYAVLSKNKLKREYYYEALHWKEALRKRYWGQQ